MSLTQPRCALASALVPFVITASLTPVEIKIEQMAYAAEVAASRPAWQYALVALEMTP